MTRILRAKTGKRNERGFSILEALIASIVLVIGISGLMALFAVAAAKNAGQGDQATRCTEYAQDKMEQLLALSYNDTLSQTVGSATSSTGGVGLTAGGSVPPVAGGSSPDGGPVTSYVDYVTSAGVVSASSTNALYVRRWQITTNTSLVNGVAVNVKTITVYVAALFTADVAQSLAPFSTLVAMKNQY